VAKVNKQISVRNRRARIKKSEGNHTRKEILNLFNAQNEKCVYCKAQLSLTQKRGYHADHLVPLISGGSNMIQNIQLLCVLCNLQKFTVSHEEFLKRFIQTIHYDV